MRVLLVSIACPPKNDPESLQVGKYVKYLSRDHEIDIVTSSHPTLWMNKDDELNKYISNAEQIIEVPIFEPKYLSIVGNKYFRKYLQPDTRMSFYKKSGKVINQLNKSPEIIYSRSYPLSSTLMAEKLVDHFKIPWVLHLSDPWVPSPLYNYHSSNYHIKTELRCFQKATKICFTSQATIDLYKSRYPQFVEKFELFPNVYDAEDILSPEKKQTPKNKIRFLYTGSLIGTRSLKLLVDCIASFAKKDQDRFELIVAGSVDQENKSILDNHDSFVDFIGFVPFKALKEEYLKADVLVSADFDFKKPEDGVYFPSKLLDYFAAQKPILAITSKNSTTEQVLKNSNHQVIYHHDKQAMDSYLNDCLNNKLNKEVTLPKAFEAEFNANRLSKLMKEICQK